MEGILHALIWALLAQFTGCQLHISVQPNRTDVEDGKDVTIRCSLNLRQTKTDRVYSIMLKRRGMTVAVMLADGVELPDRQFTVDGSLSSTTPGYAYLQVTLSNVTCSDRGDYSCRMAVRRFYRNLQLGPVSSLFTVIGKASPVSLKVTPSKPVYAVGEAVKFTCSALVKSTDVKWSWNLTSPPSEITESCSHSELDCLYRCRSSVSVTLEDRGFQSKCGYEKDFRSIKLNVTRFDESDSLPEVKSLEAIVPDQESRTSVTQSLPIRATEAEQIPNMYMPSRTTSQRDNRQKTILIYSFVSVFCFLFLCIFIYIFASDKCECRDICKQRNEKDIRNYKQGQHRMNRERVILIPASQCHHVHRDSSHTLSTASRCHHVHGDSRYTLNESDYLIPQHDMDNMPVILENEEQNIQFVVGSDSENIYEDVGQSSATKSNNCIFDSETDSRGPCTYRQSDTGSFLNHHSGATMEI